MMRIFLLFILTIFSVSAAPPPVKILPGGKTFEDGGREVDSFIVRTLDRISVAWGMCREEFSLASSEAVKESQKIIKKEVEKQTEKAVEKITESAKEAVRESLP